MTQTRISSRPKNYWYWPKPINDIDRIIDAVNTITDMDGEEWSEKKGTQQNMQELIVNAGLHISADAMSARNWMSAFQLYGLVYTKIVDKKKIITITPVGKSLKKSTSQSRKKIIGRQFKKLQIGNPSFSMHLSHTVLVNPLYFVCHVISKLSYITTEEMACFIMNKQNHSQINEAVSGIEIYRKTKNKPIMPIKTEILMKDYANRILRKSFVYAELLVEPQVNTFEINPLKNIEVKKFISLEPILKSEYIELKNKNKWFEYYGQSHKSRRTPTGSISQSQYQANKLSKTIESYVSMKMYKIKLKDLESFTQLNVSKILRVIMNPQLKNEYPILNNVSIVKNHLVVEKNSRNTTYKFSTKVKGFEHIVYDSRNSDNFTTFENSVKEIFQELNFKVIHEGVQSSGKEIYDLNVQNHSENVDELWSILIDTKARTDSFSISAGDRRAMKQYYLDYQKTIGIKNPFKCKAVCFISIKIDHSSSTFSE